MYTTTFLFHYNKFNQILNQQYIINHHILSYILFQLTSLTPPTSDRYLAYDPYPGTSKWPSPQTDSSATRGLRSWTWPRSALFSSFLTVSSGTALQAASGGPVAFAVVIGWSWPGQWCVLSSFSWPSFWSHWLLTGRWLAGLSAGPVSIRRAWGSRLHRLRWFIHRSCRGSTWTFSGPCHKVSYQSWECRFWIPCTIMRRWSRPGEWIDRSVSPFIRVFDAPAGLSDHRSFSNLCQSSPIPKFGRAGTLF